MDSDLSPQPFMFKALSICAIDLLIHYLGLFIVSSYIVSRLGWKNGYGYILFFSLIRLGGQACGIGFSIFGIQNFSWLIAYLVFTVEGYFILLMAIMLFICKEQAQVMGLSYLKKQLWFKRDSFTVYFHLFLIPANSLLVVSGTLTQGDNPSDLGKYLKGIGQILFLLQSLVLSGITIYDYRVNNVKTTRMKLLLTLIPFILIRGIFGVVSTFIEELSYLSDQIYTSTRAMMIWTLYEYLLSVTMEFLTAFCLVATYFSKERKYTKEQK